MKPNLCPLLTDFYLDIGDPNTLVKVFDWLELPALLRLSLPSGVMYHSRDHPIMPRPMESPYVIHDIIDRHKKSLRQITFLNIRLIQNIGQLDFFKGFEPQELVLGLNGFIERSNFQSSRRNSEVS